MPKVSHAQFVVDSHRLVYISGKDDAYAFSINTVTGKLESACVLQPNKLQKICERWQERGDLQYFGDILEDPRTVSVKVSPLRALPYIISWKTNEMLPNVARAMWNKQNSLKTPVKFVSAWVNGGIVVKYTPNDGMSDPMTHNVFSAGYGGVWLPVKYTNYCPVADFYMPSISLPKITANLSD